MTIQITTPRTANGKIRKTSPRRTLHRALLLGSAALLLAGCDFEVVTTAGGTIVSDPSGINCRKDSGTCIVRNYERLGDGNDDVTTRLTAIPDPGYRFSHWQGCDDTENLHCYKHMSGDIQIRAAFEPMPLAAPSGHGGALRFVALGDFGNGNTGQKLVGDAIARVCNEAGGCSFAIGLGDNIYEENPQQVYDDAFERRFEYPFINIDFPFYMSLGNHDNSLLIDGLGQFNMTGDTQVQYSYREDRISDKWVMPARYYAHSHPQGSAAPIAELYALDSNPFMSALEINPEYYLLNYAHQQGQWLDGEINGSNAVWKIAYAHHPYLSNGTHGNAGKYDGLVPLELLSYRISGEAYRKWMEKHVCGKVDVFVAGHDHEVQLLHSVPECGNTLFLVSGAASDPRELDDPSRNPVWYQQDNQLGFAMVEINGDTLTMKIYSVSGDDGHATLTYQQNFPRRRLN